MNNNTDNSNRKKNILVISGPSGTGKSTLIAKLFQFHDELKFLVSHTTRKIRSGEAEGVNYYFTDIDRFKQMAETGEFIEWANVYNNYYGTSFKEIENCTDRETIQVLDIDVQGARNIKEKFPEAVMVLVAPPSLTELKNRLIRREQKEDEEIRKRLDIAVNELKESTIYDYIIVNDRLDESFDKLNAIVTAFKSRHNYRIEELNRILDAWENK